MSAYGGICTGGCLPRGVCLEVSAREYLPRRGVSAGGCLPRGSLPWGVSAWGVHPQTQMQTPPPVNRITDRCKNITFPQLLLQTVKKNTFFKP